MPPATVGSQLPGGLPPPVGPQLPVGPQPLVRRQPLVRPQHFGLPSPGAAQLTFDESENRTIDYRPLRGVTNQ